MSFIGRDYILPHFKVTYYRFFLAPAAMHKHKYTEYD